MHTTLRLLTLGAAIVSTANAFPSGVPYKAPSGTHTLPTALEAAMQSSALGLTESANRDAYMCTAVPIGPRHAVTAGHCVSGAQITDIEASGVNIGATPVARAYFHVPEGSAPDHVVATSTPYADGADLAIIEFDEPIELMQGQQFLCGPPNPNEFTTHIGTGATEVDTSSSVSPPGLYINQGILNIAGRAINGALPTGLVTNEPVVAGVGNPSILDSNGDPLYGGLYFDISQGSCPGDSGGPAFVQRSVADYPVAGIMSNRGLTTIPGGGYDNCATASAPNAAVAQNDPAWLKRVLAPDYPHAAETFELKGWDLLGGAFPEWAAYYSSYLHGSCNNAGVLSPDPMVAPSDSMTARIELEPHEVDALLRMHDELSYTLVFDVLVSFWSSRCSGPAAAPGASSTFVQDSIAVDVNGISLVPEAIGPPVVTSVTGTYITSYTRQSYALELTAGEAGLAFELGTAGYIEISSATTVGLTCLCNNNVRGPSIDARLDAMHFGPTWLPPVSGEEPDDLPFLYCGQTP